MTVSYHKLKKYNNSIFFILLYITLIFGFVTGEDSTGGAFKDYSNQKQIVQDFSDNFHQAFFNYDSYTTRHSPVLIIILSPTSIKGGTNVLIFLSKTAGL